MAEILQLSPHVANLIAAGEVVERPASVAKELLENAVDAGAKKVTIEIQGGGMAYLRVTDDGCGMSADNARRAFLRHATSKLRNAEDLAAIGTMGFRGEALAAIASVSRIDLMTREENAIAGVSLRLEAGQILEDTETGCPAGTTIIIRDLFFNTPARMKFMKADTVESARITAAVQLQALAHPEVAFRLIREGKEVLSTPGDGKLQSAVYCVYGRDSAGMVAVESTWEKYRVFGYVSKPTDARPSRSQQTFFVNDRPVKSRLLMAALEEAYRNQLMVGKFPACVLHLVLPANVVDVNVHPAKTEVKFLNEKAVFDCVHYGVLAALNKTPDRPQMRFAPEKPTPASIPTSVPSYKPAQSEKKKEPFFRTMTAEEYKTMSQTLAKPAAIPQPEPAAKTVAALPREPVVLRQSALYPRPAVPPTPVERPAPEEKPAPAPVEEQAVLASMPPQQPWRLVGELYRSYILVEQGEEAFLIDKHAAHERILFEKLKANQEAISSQLLLTPIPVRLSPEGAAAALENREMLTDLGFELEEFGDNTLLLRQIPMDLDQQEAADAVVTIAENLRSGRRESSDTVRDEVLHTVACKAAIKAGWQNDEKELLALVKQVMQREELKYCPHGRPICITLSKKQLEKQFKRT